MMPVKVKTRGDPTVNLPKPLQDILTPNISPKTPTQGKEKINGDTTS